MLPRVASTFSFVIAAPIRSQALAFIYIYALRLFIVTGDGGDIITLRRQRLLAFYRDADSL